MVSLLSRSHWKTDQVISVDTHTNVSDSRHHTTRFHRGHLHAALLKHVSKKSIHLGKTISRAEASVNGVSLHFEDGTSAHGDILIGADGIKSVCHRRFFLQTTLKHRPEGQAVIYAGIQAAV